MNTRTLAVTTRATRIVAEIARNPLAGDVLSLQASNWDVTVQLYASQDQHRAGLGPVIGWTYLLGSPTITLHSAKDDQDVMVEVRGDFDGDKVIVHCVFHEEVAAELRDRVAWADGEATVSVHHLRAVQVGSYRTAVAA